jgi:hypothetical protein
MPSYAAAAHRRRQGDEREPPADARDQAAAAVDGARAILRDAVASGRASLDAVIESLRSLEGVAPVRDSQYIHSLEMRVAEVSAALAAEQESAAALARAKDAILDDTQRHLEHIEQHVRDYQQAADADREKRDAEQRALEAQIAAQLKELAALRQAADALSQENAVVQQRCVDIESIAHTTLAELEQAFESTQADCLQLLTLKQKRIRDLESEVAALSANFAQRHQRDKAALLTERNERNALEIQLQQRTAAASAQADAAKLSDDIARLSAEARSLTRRIASKEQQHQREVARLQAQLSAAAAAADTDAARRIDEALRKTKSETQQFLSAVCKLFQSYISVPLPLTFQTVEAVLRIVKRDLDTEQELRTAKIYFDEVKKILEVADEREAVRQVAELAKVAAERGDVANLRQTVTEFSSWLDRMAALCGGTFGASTDPAVARRAIEQALHKRGSSREVSVDELPARSKVDVSGGRYTFS